MEPNKSHLTNEELNLLIERLEALKVIEGSSILNALLELKQRRAESAYYIMDTDGIIKPIKPGQVILIKR